MIKLRLYKDRDLDDLYAIALATGAGGEDASALHEDGRIMGQIYAAPYARFCPELCFVATDAKGVAGYIVGAVDTRAFEEQLRRVWWPGLRSIYPDPCDTPASEWSADQRRCHMIHHPRETPEDVVKHYPSHVHMNLLPRAQGQGIGPALLELWISAARNHGATGLHVGSNRQNARAYGFWQSRGFEPLASEAPAEGSRTVWLGRQLEES
ncbi:GNAT family N-acetyltransferase [Denitrobaculum tricleocarpae]|uniref:GNAT family N-acetyltransferase n=1 Tax=Denitrobaculum tricleocarpae TaxID=2591009 RepID=A0A545U2U3_9PROT|nr:GNAT family N-acetyltransferase [Denitrobaculum tricleocarpae]TQV83791.1 GNAT family N-acetyltransferase [Denitrobaculum tricleocarpae]